jgi:hypothetical protein
VSRRGKGKEPTIFIIWSFFCVRWWYCYITVDFATATSENGVYVTQNICHKIIFLFYCSLIMTPVANLTPVSRLKL